MWFPHSVIVECFTGHDVYQMRLMRAALPFESLSLVDKESYRIMAEVCDSDLVLCSRIREPRLLLVYPHSQTLLNFFFVYYLFFFLFFYSYYYYYYYINKVTILLSLYSTIL